VTAQFARATAARVEDVSLRFTGVDAGEIAPSEIQPLVDGEPWVVYGRYSAAGIGRAELRGTLQGEQFFLEVPVELPEEAEREGLGALWAAARIRDLEDAEAGLAGRRAESNKKRIVALSVEHHVASKYASFVVVERRSGDRRATGQPEARPVPVHGPAGWDTGREDALEGGGGAMMTRAGTVKLGMSANQVLAAPARMQVSASTSAPVAMAGPGARARSGAAPAQRRYAQAPAVMASGSKGSRPGAMPSAPPTEVMHSEEVRSFSQGAADGAASAPRAMSKKKGSAFEAVGEAVRGAVGRLLGKGESSEAEAKASSGGQDELREEEAFAAAPAAGLAAAQAAGGGDPMALLEQQLASGLWEGADGTEGGRLLATAQVLAACHAAQIDTAHPTFGAQIRKAVEAVCKAAGELAKKGGAERAIMAALAAAFLVASGRRLRAQVIAAAQDSGVDGLRAFAAELTGVDVAKRKLGELGVA
jgi:Ca-activated chloride channel family protein